VSDDEEPLRPPDWRILRLSGMVLIGTGVFLAVTRDNVSETLIATLLGFGIVLLGVKLPDSWGFPGRGRFNEDDKA